MLQLLLKYLNDRYALRKIKVLHALTRVCQSVYGQKDSKQFSIHLLYALKCLEEKPKVKVAFEYGRRCLGLSNGNFRGFSGYCCSLPLKKNLQTNKDRGTKNKHEIELHSTACAFMRAWYYSGLCRVQWAVIGWHCQNDCNASYCESGRVARIHWQPWSSMGNQNIAAANKFCTGWRWRASCFTGTTFLLN